MNTRGELYPLAKSGGRHAQEPAQARSTAAAHRRRQEGSRASFRVREDPNAGSGPGETFSVEVDQAKLKAAQQRDGHYLLRSNLTGEDPAVCGRATCN